MLPDPSYKYKSSVLSCKACTIFFWDAIRFLFSPWLYHVNSFMFLNFLFNSLSTSCFHCNGIYSCFLLVFPFMHWPDTLNIHASTRHIICITIENINKLLKENNNIKRNNSYFKILYNLPNLSIILKFCKDLFKVDIVGI